MTDTSLSFNVFFNDTSAITNDIKDPDTLEFQFVMPEVIIDAATFESLEDSQIKQELSLVPQMSKTEYEEIQEMVK